MNIFVTTDFFSNYFLVSKLEEELAHYDLQKCTLLTTNRIQDNPFISFALMKGMDFKIYEIKDFLTDEVISKVADNIDFLVIFSKMDNYFYRKLFALCDKTIYIDGEKIDVDNYRQYLKIHYTDELKKIIEKPYDKNGEDTCDTFEIFNRQMVNKLAKANRVKIRVYDSIIS